MNRKQLIEIVKLTTAAQAAGQRALRLSRQSRKLLHHAACAAVRPCPECTSWHLRNDANRARGRANLRDLNLAYAYLRGMPYAVVERTHHTAANSWAVARTLWDLLDAKVPQQPLDVDIKAWLAGKAPAWPSFPGEALTRYRQLMHALDHAANDEHCAMLTGRGDSVWDVLTHEERVLIEDEEEAAAAAGRAA